MARIVLAKECSVCSEMKPIEDFYNADRGIGGKKARCKKCSSKESAKVEAARRERDPEAFKEKNRQKTRKYQKKEQDKSLESATRKRQPWTSWEIELLDREDLTIAKVAEMTNRTHRGVASARWRRNTGTWVNHRDKTMMKEDGGY